MIRKLILTLCFSVLAVVLAGCSAQAESSPQASSPMLPTDLLPTTEAPVLLPSNTSLPTAGLSLTLAPTSTPEPASMPTPTSTSEMSVPLPATDTPLPPALPTPAGPVIAHLQPGQAITVMMIHMLDATSGWAIGGQGQESDHVLITADGAQTWRDVTPPEPDPAGSNPAALGFFADAATAWVTYSSQGGMTVPATAVVWCTQDGGQNWQSSSPLDLQGLNELYLASDLVFVGPQDGWLLVHVGVGMSHDYVVLYRTTDGGQTWARLIDPYGDSGIQGCQKTALVFTSPQTGWLTGDCNGVMAGAFLFQTADGGQTWQPVTLPTPAGAPNLFSDPGPACGTWSPIFLSPQDGKLIVRCLDYTQDPAVISYYLFTTHDGGSSWASTSSPAGSLAFTTDDTGWALGRDLFHTADGGQTWMEVKTVNWDGQFSFVSDSLGWAVARAASDAGTLIALVQTSDGGQTWSEVYPAIAP